MLSCIFKIVGECQFLWGNDTEVKSWPNKLAFWHNGFAQLLNSHPADLTPGTNDKEFDVLYSVIAK